jgi:large subunit ribosomal protein L21
MHAIIEDSGTQIKVAPGDVVEVDLRELPDGAQSVTFDRVLLVAGDGDAKAKVGTPYVSGASVQAEVIGEVRADKVTSIRFKRRKGVRVKRGHRQRLLRVRISAIG